VEDVDGQQHASIGATNFSINGLVCSLSFASHCNKISQPNI